MILPDKTWAQLNSSMILYSICHESLVNQLKIVLAHELRNWIIKIYTVIFSNSSFVDSQGTRNWRFKYWRMDWPICWVFVSLLLPVSPEMTSTLLFWMEIHIFFQISILKQFQNESRYQFFYNWIISLKKKRKFCLTMVVWEVNISIDSHPIFFISSLLAVEKLIHHLHSRNLRSIVHGARIQQSESEAK